MRKRHWMDAETYHGMLLEKNGMLGESERRKPNEHPFNGFVFPDPTEIIDYDPKKNYGNFKHVVGGDHLVYCEVANSTPVKGHHTVLDEYAPLTKLCVNTSCVYSKSGVMRMVRKAIGISTVTYPYMNAGYTVASGEVLDSAVLKREYMGQEYLICCLLCWSSQEKLKSLGNRLGLMTAIPSFNVSRTICCVCGRDYMCSHCWHLSPFSDNALCISSISGIDYVVLKN